MLFLFLSFEVLFYMPHPETSKLLLDRKWLIPVMFKDLFDQWN